MRNRNILTPTEYLLTSIGFGIYITLLFYFCMYHPIEALGETGSLIFFVALLSLNVIGCFLTWEKRRNILSVVINTLFPLLLYGLVRYWNFPSKSYRVLLGAALILALLYGLYVFILNRSNDNHPFGEKLIFIVLGMRTILCVGLMVTVLPLLVFATYRIPVATSFFTAEDFAENAAIENRIEDWATLSTNEQMEICAYVLSREMSVLEIDGNYAVRFLVSDQPDMGTLAGSWLVLLNYQYLQTASPSEVLRLLFMESFTIYLDHQFEMEENHESIDEDLLMEQYVDYIEARLVWYEEKGIVPCEYLHN